jgi:hypothetical protein
MKSVEILGNRKEVIHEASRLVLAAKTEVLGMGRQIAWIETDDEFGGASRKAMGRERAPAMRMLAVKNEGDVKKYAEAFEAIGAYVRYYKHGDIRVVVSDRKDALIAIPAKPTMVLPYRDYTGISTNDSRLVEFLVKRFEEMWRKADKEKEATWKDKVSYFWRDNKGGFVVGIITLVLGALLSYAIQRFG